MAETYLYIYRNDDRRQVYIGIGTSPSRVWQGHNPTATDLLNDAGTKVFITSDPFPDRASAERAESAAICGAAAAGVDVLSDRDDLVTLTNIAKVGASRHLVPALLQRDGTVRYDELERTAIVTLSLDRISDSEGRVVRPTLHGGRDAQIVEERASRYWQLGRANWRRQQGAPPEGTLPRDVGQLIAIQKGTHTIIGAWKLTDEQWKYVGPRWQFLTGDPIENFRGKWFDWCGAHPSNGVTWSRDIRARL